MKHLITLGAKDGKITIIKQTPVVDEAISDFVSWAGITIDLITQYSDLMVLILPGDSKQEEAYRIFRPHTEITMDQQ